MLSRRGGSPFGWDQSTRALLLLLAFCGVAFQFFTGRDHRRDDAPPRLIVSLNDAPAPVLGTLPRLGPARVDAILAARRKQPFASLDDFDLRVRGIGPATRKAIQPLVQIDR